MLPRPPFSRHTPHITLTAQRHANAHRHKPYQPHVISPRFAHLAIVMNGTLPVFAGIIGWLWLKDRPDRWRIAGMAVILAGCGLIGWDRTSIGVSADAWVGHLMFMAASPM